MLSSSERTRYDRHLLLPEVGRDGQERLKAGSVLLVGAGGLGSPLALYLAAAGIGRIGLVDFDVVDVSNLQRQVLYGTQDVGRPKLEAAASRISDLNPHVDVCLHPTRLTRTNELDILRSYDVVADGSDNFATRYLVNDACVLLGKPNVYGSVYRFEGQASVFGLGGPCYRCLYDHPPPPDLVPSCAEGGVLGVLPGLIGSIQATEVLKLLLGIGETLSGRLLMVDALTMQFRTISLPRDPDCPVCGDHPTITALQDYDAFCGVRSDSEGELPTITRRRLQERLDAGRSTFVLDVRTREEYEREHIGGTLIPLHELDERMGELEAARASELLVVHCQSGARSAQAVKRLLDAGFDNAVNLEGGLRDWRDAEAQTRS